MRLLPRLQLPQQHVPEELATPGFFDAMLSENAALKDHRCRVLCACVEDAIHDWPQIATAPPSTSLRQNPTLATAQVSTVRHEYPAIRALLLYRITGPQLTFSP
jgi:hypothetical protein